MADEDVETVDEWVAFYRDEFGLPVRRRGGFAMLAVTGRIGVVHLPKVRAEKVCAALGRHGVRVPVLARNIRWSFFARPDSRPEPQLLAAFDRLDIGLPTVGSAVMLPTGLGRWTREGCFWANPPNRGDTLPPLSGILAAALVVGAGTGY
ncbi:hypothetical protein [Nocardia sp. CNY236]|uniref:hypothetical protein n=1 Tax=Nocardia sp. CNY236 TaxID=1169152 RepID=UPI00048E7F70|nr:hypothetical protein [Nocardia sp. CNY236]